MYDYNYEKMSLNLIRNLNKIYETILIKDIDIFERGVEETIKKQRHQEGAIIKLPEGQKQCKITNL
jgi:hypothetical protein